MVQVLAPACVPVFTSNGLNLYFHALTAHFGQWLMDSAGQVLAVASTPYPFETSRPLWSEQYPDL